MSEQYSNHLSRHACWTFESGKNFGKIRTTKKMVSCKTSSQERCRKCLDSCSAPSPWKRGTDGLLRKFFPKGRNITDTLEDFIQQKIHELKLVPGSTLAIKQHMKYISLNFFALSLKILQLNKNSFQLLRQILFGYFLKIISYIFHPIFFKWIALNQL